VRIAVACFLAALLAFATQALVWSRFAVAPEGPIDPGAVLESFEREDAGTTVDVGALYRGRQELLDPRTALPTWHHADYAEAAAVHARLARCPAAPLERRPTSVALAKAYDWHAATCAGGVPESATALLTQPPLMHPSGRSYASLAMARGAKPGARDVHVLELSALDRALLSGEERVLADLPPASWTSLSRGDNVVLTPTALAIAEQGPLGLSRLRIHPRGAWEQHLRRVGLSLAERSPSATCARPASPDLCWEPLPMSARHASIRAATMMGTLALLAGSALALAWTVMRERRRAHADRLHVLRTLTHELRTPATSLKLDIEPLRAAYDALPPACQEPLLRLSDGIERLLRVLHRSARYMSLFETPGVPSTSLLRLEEVPSLRDLFEQFVDEWPEGVTVDPGSPDRPVVVDPEWLGVAVRNLVENAVRHGRPPVQVSYRATDDVLHVRVVDGGRTPGLALDRATNAFERAPKSEGLGLGLAIVARVAKLFGGRLLHEGTPTAFELRIPLTKGASP
jgi:signal transduction histidine kinase